MDFLHPLQGLVWVFGEVFPSAVTWSSPSHTEPLLGLAGEIEKQPDTCIQLMLTRICEGRRAWIIHVHVRLDASFILSMKPRTVAFKCCYSSERGWTDGSRCLQELANSGWWSEGLKQSSQRMDMFSCRSVQPAYFMIPLLTFGDSSILPFLMCGSRSPAPPCPYWLPCTLMPCLLSRGGTDYFTALSVPLWNWFTWKCM